jgi:outer membrane protein OmpA-like peptidoglycan-associated protein
VIDTADNCPDEPGPPENQGCAKEQLVKITGGKLEILDVVYFKLNKAVIEKRSYALLDNVASVLGAHEEIKKVRVEGHTDSQGSDASNKKLSQNRANAVRKYLVDAGVDASRLDAMGFGEEKALAGR